MAYENPSPVGHKALVQEILRYACALNTLGTPVYTGTGNGQLLNLRSTGATVTETWTLECTAAAANGGTFSVTGSVSGAQADATVGVAYDNGKIAFIITDGTTDFIVGDDWSIASTQAELTTAGDTPWTLLREIGVVEALKSSELGDYEAFKAYDNDSATGWKPAIGDTVPGCWIGWEEASEVEVYSVTIRVSGESYTYSPTNFDLQYSDDGVNWQTKQNFTFSSWQSITSRTATCDPGTEVGPRKFWRLYINGTAHGTLVHIPSIDPLQTRGGTTCECATRHEAIIYNEGLAAQDQIWIALGYYDFPTTDIYSMQVATLSGFDDTANLADQPGISTIMSVPLWNFAIPTWLVVNEQRICAVMKVDTVWVSFYIGEFFPYSSPNQYPLPAVCGAINANTDYTDYSDTNNKMPYNNVGGNCLVRDPSGAWNQPDKWPWQSGDEYKDYNSEHHLMPVVMHDASPAVYGELDGIFYVSGFNNAAENIVQADGVDYLVFQDVWRTGNTQHIALKLE